MALIGNLKGSTGTPGPQWFTNTVDPTSPGDDGVGNNGDFWLNTTSGDLFKKTSGTWV